MKPVILTLGDEDLVQLVKSAGFDVCDANTPNSFYSAILVDTRDLYRAKAIDVIKHVRKIEHSKILVFAFTEEFLKVEEYKQLIELGFDGCFDPSTSVEIIVARLGSALRIKNMHDESKIRFNTLKALDNDIFEYTPNNPKPIRILLFGRPGPQSLEISTLLDSLKINYVAAMTSFMAFEYLHRGQFDGIIFLAENDSKGANGFISGLRRNSRLFHLPCAVFINEDFGDTESLLKQGASEVNFFGINNELAIARLLTLIDEQRRRENLSISFAMTRTVKVADALTGLYNRTFFFEHLKALLKQIGIDHQALSIGLIKIQMPQLASTDQIRKIITQTGSMVSRLIRTEDTAARLDNTVFAILCPATDENECTIALNRICAVLETSAYDSGTNKPTTITTKTVAYPLVSSHTIGEIEGLIEIFNQAQS